MNKHIFIIALVVGVTMCLPSKASLVLYDVPSEMQFAGIKLVIDNEAKEIIQEKADEFKRKNFYHTCVSRARLYFPIMEEILTSHQVPTDVKYLSLQLSYLIANLGTHEGVGFWQISDSLALQLGMLVNEEVDERKHLILSTEFIASYLKDKNYVFRNWLYTIMNYRKEVIDAMNQIDKSLIGANYLQITPTTPSVILNLIAYIVAYKDKIESEASFVELLAYHNTKGKSLEEIAKSTHIPFEQIKEHNRWLLTNKIPSYKQFPVLLPVSISQKEEIASLINQTMVYGDTNKINYPILSEKIIKRFRDKTYTFVKANGLRAMIAEAGDKVTDMAEAAEISPSKFRQLNDMTDFDDIKQGQVYYLERKNKKTDAKEHVLETGESFWDVSQRYGVRLSTLVANNRLTEKDTAKVGRVVWLSTRRPENTPVEYRALAQNPIYAQPDNTVIETPSNTDSSPVLVKEEDTNSKQVQEKKTDRVANDSVYIAMAGETITDVYRKTNVPLDKLIAWNDLKNTELSEGQKIRLTPPRAERTSDNKGTLSTNANPDFLPPSPDDVAVIKSDSTQQAIPNSEEHLVQKGESLSIIAQKYGLKVADLRVWNKLDAKSTIRAGQKLRLTAPAAATISPSNASIDSADVIHTVQDKETLYGIARKYGIPQSEIAKINNIDENAPLIRKGQTLTIKRRTAPRNAMNEASTQTSASSSNNEVKYNPINNEPIKNEVGTGNAVINTPPVTNTNVTTPTNLNLSITPVDEITMPYVLNPPSSGSDIIEVDPRIDYFDNVIKRYPYGSKEDIAKWNGLTLAQVLSGTIPSERRTLVVTLKGYEESLKYGNVIYPKSQTNQQITSGSQPITNNSAVDVTPPQVNIQQVGNTNSSLSSGTGVTQKIPVNPFSDNFFTIKSQYNLTDEDIARLNNIPIDVVKGGSIPMEITELIVSGSGSAGGTITVNPTETASNATAQLNTVPLDQAIIHNVNAGETIYGLAQRYNVAIDSISIWNNLKDGRIDFGQSLIVGRKPAMPTTAMGGTEPPSFHILQKGETLYGISKKYGIDINLLIENNPKIFKDKIVRNGDTVFLKKPETLLAPPQTALAMDEGYYIVQDGDDMYKICEKFKIKPSDLKTWNKLAPGLGVTKPIPTGTKLVVDADLAEALKNQTGELPRTSLNSEPIYHFVVKGETLSSIAKKYDTEVDKLKELNDKPEGNIREGEKLLVGRIYYHIVTKGENLSLIARKYNISNEQLKVLNKKKDDLVKEGEKLIVGK
ncbi:LysM peptidoglycan-binding domain-containing protein [Thermoflexibacter ruber]|uniref:LysM repeat-containing protein n=1 Tax=Thermoflexibacter ruber TaxID=1003 RepID=A0A1I2K8N6_9BACT|nr:LysM peptidoglycan-binding domain-containing protein [Thermoflexibacter ruber]SFF62560.1 LysM repeat-containing protein [Thermoflexibacter ruber]